MLLCYTHRERGLQKARTKHTAKKIKRLYTRICQQPHQAFSLLSCLQVWRGKRRSLQMPGVSREQLLRRSAKVQCKRSFLLAVLQSGRREQVKATKDCDCWKEPTHYCYRGGRWVQTCRFRQVTCHQERASTWSAMRRLFHNRKTKAQLFFLRLPKSCLHT